MSGYLTKPDFWMCFQKTREDSLAPANSSLYSKSLGTPVAVQKLRLHVPSAGSSGSIPGQGTRPHRLQLKACMPQLRPHMPQLRLSTAK